MAIPRPQQKRHWTCQSVLVLTIPISPQVVLYIDHNTMPTMSSRELRKHCREEQDNDKLLAELSGEPLDNDASFDPVVPKKQIFDSVNSTMANDMLGQHWKRYFIDIFSQFAPPDQGNPNYKEHRDIYIVPG